MSAPKIMEINCETNEEIVRDMTDVELAEYEKRQIDAENARLAEEAKVAAKEVAKTKLAVLGLTADDLEALGL